MITITDYIQPELLVLIPVLYLTGEALKKSELMARKHIPISLGIFGIILSLFYMISECEISIEMVFSAMTQGILCAGASVYANQIYKQAGKDE